MRQHLVHWARLHATLTAAVARIHVCCFTHSPTLRPDRARFGSALSSHRRPQPQGVARDARAAALDPHYRRFRRFRAAPIHADHVRRVLLLSDLHTDYPANREWLHDLCASSQDSDAKLDAQTMALVAGDVSHDLDILRWTLRTLKGKFGEVVFTPGNHDLWLDRGRTTKPPESDAGADSDSKIGCRRSGDGDGCATSVDKLERVLQTCLDEGVRVGPVRAASSLWVLPLLSWHHPSFDTEPPIKGWGGIPPARRAVADYSRTAWPDPISSLDDSAAEFMDGLNDVISDYGGIGEGDGILSFSHFLPRIELIPEKRYLTLPTLHACIGSAYVERRVRRLQKCRTDGGSNHVHAFGHSHLAWDHVVEGIRYVHAPLAYPREWEQRQMSLEIGSMKGGDSRKRFPVCVYFADKHAREAPGSAGDARSGFASTGFPSRWLGGWWSRYYSVVPRQPHRNRELAPWAARRFRQLPGGRVEPFVHSEVARKIKMEELLHEE